MTPEVHVIISTYAPRRAWLAEMLEQLTAQTVRPDLVVVLDDPPHPTDGDDLFARFVPELPELLWHRNVTREGPAARWRYIAYAAAYATKPHTIICTLDDDVILAADYIERSVQWCQQVMGAVSWWPLTPAEIDAHHPGVEIPILAGGLTTLRGAWLCGINEHPLAERHLAWEMTDDVFLSWWLWNRGIPIVRPAPREPFPFQLREEPVENTRSPIYSKNLEAQRAELGATGWPHDAPAVRLPAGRWPR